jgi:hypothetical protein
MIVRAVYKTLPCVLLVLLGVWISSCAEKSLTTDPGDTAAAPIISSVSPNPAAIGAELTIDGVNFGTDPGAIKVYIGDVEAVVKSVTPTKIVIVVPDGAQAGNEAIKVVKSGKTGESSDSLTVLASPFPYTRVWVTVSGIDIEYAHYAVNQDTADRIFQKTMAFQQPINADSSLGCRPPKWCQLRSLRDTVLITCSSLCGSSPSTGQYIQYLFSAVLDTMKQKLSSVQYVRYYSYGPYTAPTPVTTESVDLRLQNVSYTIGADGTLIAELTGSEILDHILFLHASQNNKYSYPTRIERSEAQRITLIKPDAVIRIVLAE